MSLLRPGAIKKNKIETGCGIDVCKMPLFHHCSYDCDNGNTDKKL